MDEIEQLVTDPGPCLTALASEYHRAGVYSNGAGNLDFCESVRRMRWPGQSVDGRKWDKNQPEGEPAMPWDGCSDTRVPTVDEIINEEAEAEVVGFHRADIRGEAVNATNADQAALASTYLHWLVRRKLRRQLKLEVELSTQYPREYSWCAAYVGWERDIARKKTRVTLQTLQQFAQLAFQQRMQQMQAQMTGQPAPEGTLTEDQIKNYMELPRLVVDPSAEEEAATILRDVYQFYVQETMRAAGEFFEEEVENQNLLNLSPGTARQYVRELRQDGETDVLMPYVCKNGPVVYVLKPWAEIVVPKGTVELQKARAIFWRRRMSLAELESMRGTWSDKWIEEAAKTKGMISSWATNVVVNNAGAPREIGGVTYTPVPIPGDDHVEVVYGFVRKVDEEGVSGIYLTVFSPFLSKPPAGGEDDFVAVHELLDDAAGYYPFFERKRENVGRGVEETRGIPEIANTWQAEEKCQRDGLFNRTQLDTLPPVKVPSLGGVDYRLGPAAQIPLKRGDEISFIDLGGRPPSLTIELLQLLKQRSDNYFARTSEDVPPMRSQTHQLKQFGDFCDFWGQIFIKMFSLALRYNKAEVARVCGVDEAQITLTPEGVLEDLDVSLVFDVRELDPDFLMQKLDAMNQKVLPSDAAGVMDRAKWTAYQARSIDPVLAQQLTMDKGAASQAIFKGVQNDFTLMSDGQEPGYGQDADPAAPMKQQFAQSIVQQNPKYRARLSEKHPMYDADFMARVEKYLKSLQFNVDQQKNKQIGRIGVAGATMAA